MKISNLRIKRKYHSVVVSIYRTSNAKLSIDTRIQSNFIINSIYFSISHSNKITLSLKGSRKLVKADEINADITKSLKSSDGVKRAKEPKARVVKTTGGTPNHERVVTKVKAPRAKRVQNLWKNFQGVLFIFTKTTLVSSKRKKMSSKPYISKCIDLERCPCFDFARFLYDCPTQLSRGKW